MVEDQRHKHMENEMETGFKVYMRFGVEGFGFGVSRGL